MYASYSNTNYSRKSTFILQLFGIFSLLSSIILVSCKDNAVQPTTPIDYSTPTTQISFAGNIYNGIGYNSSNATFTGNAGILNALTITSAPVSGNATIVDYVSNSSCTGCSFIIFKINNNSYFSKDGTVSINTGVINVDANLYQLSNITLTSPIKGTIYF